MIATCPFCDAQLVPARPGWDNMSALLSRHPCIDSEPKPKGFPVSKLKGRSLKVLGVKVEYQ